ncbi:hypothetical protein [Luteimonas vadosa]|uniref:Gluconate 2-dehydrogenase subunit 3 family protein n=1 Tax=Luteimonas vadosa TaxID=1165507 RepID=A0ABP9E5J0_9GAMM
MANRSAGIVAAMLFACLPTQVEAGPATDALSECLVESTDAGDRQALVRWIFVAMSRHPDLVGMTRLEPDRIAEVDREAGALFERLLLTDCVALARRGFREEDAAAFQGAFQTLGMVAGEGVFAHPEVDRAARNLLRNVDMAQLQRALTSPPQ